MGTWSTALQRQWRLEGREGGGGGGEGEREREGGREGGREIHVCVCQPQNIYIHMCIYNNIVYNIGDKRGKWIDMGNMRTPANHNRIIIVIKTHCYTHSHSCRAHK